MADEQQALAFLAQIDAATTKAAQNTQAIADITQTVSDEIDKFLADAASQGGVSQALLDGLAATAQKAQVASDAGDALVPMLQAVASKGAAKPVPVPVPPAPTV